MADEDVAWYQRMLDAQEDQFDAPWCWTVVQPLTMPVTVAEVARRLGGDPASIEQVAGWAYDETDALHLQQVGPAVVMCQTGGWEGVRDEALRWLSDGASVHSSWWSPANGRSFVCYAAFGRILTRLEHLDDDQPAGERPTALDEDRASLRDDLDYPSQLAFVERRTGIRLDPAWLDQPHATVVISTPIPDDPQPPGTFPRTDPDLAALFLLADESTQRDALRWVLDSVAEEHDLRGEPAVRAVLEALPRDWPAGEDLSAQLSALRFQLTQEVNASPGGSPERWRLYYRMRAVEAFGATVPNSRGGWYSPDTLWYAQQALQSQQRWPSIRAQLWQRVRPPRRSDPPPVVTAGR
ncbi:hypothetical protein [Rugosimonospora africana]|uniref:Uncharacterized protein n=1 Tax=Rugosimonospora africana TaxID=556532 RepID=A0A8J3QUQ1_9ACTN|nr:hypothetical protein [Rugosimonospora africana]GIH17163.1 hypothetical protein Raf01_53350 [Rugosimonospora africana]